MKLSPRIKRAVCYLPLFLVPLFGLAQSDSSDGDSPSTSSLGAYCPVDTSAADPLSSEAQDCIGASAQVINQVIPPIPPASFSSSAPNNSVANSGHGLSFPEPKEIYSWKLSGTNYVGTLNYKGTHMTATESGQDLAQSYSGVLKAGTSLFSTMSDDLSKSINKEIEAKGLNSYGYRGSQVVLGNKLSFNMTGQGTDTAVAITIPSITASLVFKKVELGIIHFGCTETIKIPSKTIQATFNINTGVLKPDPIDASGITASANCSDNIPLIGGFLANLGDKLINKDVQAQLNKLNTSAGYPMKAENFGGINQLLKSANFESNGTNYGPLLEHDLTNFFQTGKVDLDVYNPTANLPTLKPNANSPPASTTQPLISLNIDKGKDPQSNISLNVQIQQNYSSVGHQAPQNPIIAALENNPLIRAAVGLSLRNDAQKAAQNQSQASSAVQLGAVSLPSSAAINSALATSAGSISSDGKLTNQVKVLQQDLINRFESVAPSITELVHDTTTSNKVVDLQDLPDSAIFTGVYLASQCLRSAASGGNPAEQKAANTQIEWALESVERLFDVSDKPGLLSRFAYNSNDPKSKQLGFAKTPTKANGWTKSTTKPGWNYQGDTSRDQYSGIMFGLGVCNQVSPDPNIQKRTKNRILSAVSLLSGNAWRIPENTGTSGNLSLQTQAAWLKLASVAQPVSSANSVYSSQYANAMKTLTTNLKQEVETEINPTIINNYYEYYGWNLAYLQTYPVLQFEKDPATLNYWQNYLITKMWNETSNHGNAEFTFMKLGSMGVQSNRDLASFNQSLESLDTLAFKNRRDFPVANSTNPAIAQAQIPKEVYNYFNSNGYSIIGQYLNPVQAANPLPMQNRVPDTFMWEISPFQLDGGGKGLIEAPCVDTIFAYWLGRYHHLIDASN